MPSRWHALVALICLLLVEALCFGPGIKQIGFYLDDWSMFSQLHFCSQDFFSLMRQCLSDIRVQIRPLEAPYFVLLQLLFNDRPLGAHLVNCGMEVLSAWFLYLSLTRIISDRALSLVAALLFLLYPSHDATHYWITASSATLSMMLYTMSLWLSLKLAQGKRWLWLSVTVFACSVFNYEAYMPLCAVNVVCILFVRARNTGWRNALLPTALTCLPYAAVVAAMWAYQRLYLTSLKTSYTRPLTLDPQYMLSVVQHGLSNNLGNEGIRFYWERTHDAIAAGLPPATMISFALLALCTLASLLFLSSRRQESKHPALPLLFLGLFTLLCSYSIFALAADYVPTLQTTMNRINYGGALGASMMLAGLLGCANALFKTAGKTRAIMLSALLCPLLTFFTLSNWGLSKPWILSWNVQKHIRQLLAHQGSRFHAGDTIILANAPRYVQWAPMYDGVWDFEPMLKLTLNNPNLNGNVVSERLSVSSTGIADISLNFVCGKYPFKNLYLLVPTPEQWFSIGSADEFIQTVETHGMGFGLSPEAVKRWKQEALKISEAS